MTQIQRLAATMRRTMLIVFAAVMATGAWAQDADPLIAIDLPTTGPQSFFGDWLEDALRGEDLRVRWLHTDDAGELQEAACVVTWSDPERSPGETKRLREHIRSGGGIIYVVGEGRAHLRRARAFLGPLDIDVRELDAGAGSAEWASHPLTEGSPGLGAVSAGSTISGMGASPLIRSGGRQIAVAFDWGPLGRAVILDHSVLFDQLYETSPRPAVRDFLLRAALWTADAPEAAADVPAPTERPQIPSIEELIGQEAAAPVEHRSAVIDLPADNRDNWPQLRELLMAELDGADIEVDEPRQREGEPLITSGDLERTGLVVIGSSRELDQVHISEALAVGWFFKRGGRILAIPHGSGPTMSRMAGFNKLLTQLRIAASLEREGGRAHLGEHPITRGIRVPVDGLPMRGGAWVWAPLTDPLVTVRGGPAAVAWQSDEGRIVVIDGQLLLPQGGASEPHPEMLRLLRNAIEWLAGEL